MYIVIEIETKQAYYSKCITPLCKVLGKDRHTIANWFNKPEIALKRGYIVAVGKQLKSNKQGRM